MICRLLLPYQCAYVKDMKTDFDVIIVGAGLVGLTSALACAESGAKIALLDRTAIKAGTDGRASALSATSLRLFGNVKIDLSSHLQPIQDMLVTEGTPDSPWRLHFGGDDDGKDLGALIENPALKSALIDRVKSTTSIQCLENVSIQDFVDEGGKVTLQTDRGQFSARLLIAADGRQSSFRRKSGITVQRFDYDAVSLVTTVSHELPHDGLAWQRIIKGGALAVLPLTENRSQIVWSGPTKAVTAAAALEDAYFLSLLSEKMGGYLGAMELTAPRQTYPLKLQVADSFSKGRIALVGDAAHIIHPLAGQGLNLGLRDVAALADGVKQAVETGQDIGVTGLLDYDVWRNVDTRSLGLLTHVISEVSGTKFTAIGHARRLVLVLTNRFSGLKSALIERAAGEGRELPSLMK